MTEEQFDQLIDLIDDLRNEAHDAEQLAMIDDYTINRIRILCGLPYEDWMDFHPDVSLPAPRQYPTGYSHTSPY